MGECVLSNIVRQQEAPAGCLFFAFILFVFVPFMPRVVEAEILIEEVAPLDFGTLAITANDTVSTFTFPYTGTNLVSEGNIVLVVQGVPGRYALSGFPADTNIAVEADDTNLTAGGTGISEPLVISDYDFNDLRTNSLGEAELRMGGTLSTSSNGVSYEDALYSGTTQLRFRYWQPAVGEYVVNSKNIELRSALNTSLEVEEVQVMSFGTLYARTTADDQASITMAPDGSLSIASPGNSRIVSLSAVSPGVLRVTGAVAFYGLTVEPDPGSVLVKHRDNPDGGPHFILSGLSSDPQGIGRTDENGMLEIQVGATLTTQDTTETVIYPAGVYEGTYQMTLSY